MWGFRRRPSSCEVSIRVTSRSKQWTHAVRREFATASVIAAVMAMTVTLVAAMWSHRVLFGLVVGVSMLCAVLTAGLLGTVIPIVSKRFGFDPATTAGPFETAMQDVIGFSVFLWTATLLSCWL